ncbi:MAG: DsbA family protein [Verrucomicrobiota bacterium]|nr:DsbA family protein [Verrucomicrobiota bacterium]
MKRFLPFLLILLVGAGAIAGGFLLYRAKRADFAASPATSPNEQIGLPGATPAHIRGGAKASVTLEEFGDYQCPPCASLSVILLKLEHDYGDKLRVVFRQFPLAMHNHAAEAARAAEAAGLQNKFWELHDTLYRDRNRWAAAPDVGPIFAEYAGNLGLDVARFQRDRETEKVKERIETDQKRARSIGVTSTPTVFLNDHMVPPISVNETGLRKAIDDAIAGKPPAFLASPSPSPANTITLPIK